MRLLLGTATIVVLMTVSCFADQQNGAQQLGDVRPRPVFSMCPAGMELNRMLNACVAVAPNGCCAPNPQRAVCVNPPAPGQARWAGRPGDLRSQAIMCPR